MFMPSIFSNRNAIDDFFDFPFSEYPKTSQLMKTDIKEMAEGYEVSIAMPGVEKENITAELKNGYLTITATNETKKEEGDENSRYIRRERYCGSSSRSFYVGKNITEEDIHAKYENGVLTLNIPKADAVKHEEEKKFISIEG